MMITLVIFLPVLIVFIYLGYRKYLQHQRRIMNDELILKLAKEGQTLTPDIVEAIRRDEKKPSASEQKGVASADSYQKLCTGGALVVGGLIVLIRNRVFGLVMIVIGLFTLAQGAALYLSCKDQNTTASSDQKEE